MVKIVLTGGGTGGHIMPLMAVAMEIKKQFMTKFSEELDFLLITSVDGQFVDIVKQMNISYKLISAGKLRRYASAENIIDIFKIPVGILQSLWHLYWFMPDAIFAKGGYVSFPVVVAGWLLRIPIVIHESDVIPGLANRLLARFTDRVAVAFEATKEYFPARKVVWTGNPVRVDLFRGSKKGAQEVFGLKEGKPVLLVTGGSQGAKILNDYILEALPMLAKHAEIIHISGINNYTDIKTAVSEMSLPELKNYHLYPFLTDSMKDAYAAADLVLSRAGANVIAEIIALGKASILIPLAGAANDHQVKNAFYFAKRGAAVMVEESNLQIHMLTQKIITLLGNPMERFKLERNAKALSIPHATELVAEEILKFVK